MFLFTTPPEPPASQPPAAVVRQAEPALRPAEAAGPVVAAIRQGAERTGTDFGYLLSTAKRESALDPAAKASTSSAAGLFQFIEQTWLGLIKSEGDKIGLGRYADAISPRASGGFAVDDSGTRSEILRLREDPALASVMAGTLTQQNRDALSAATGRDPNAAELYMAHLLGARGASDLIRTAGANPGRPAALDLPEAAAANRSIFFERDGRPRGAGEVYAAITNPQGGPASPAPVAPIAVATSAAPADPAAPPPLFKPDGPVLYSLFQTENRSGSPVSASLAKLWRANTTRQDTVAVAFFPSSAGSGREVASFAPPAAANPPIGTATAALVAALAVPLPPARPILTDPAPTRSAGRGRAPRLASR